MRKDGGSAFPTVIASPHDFPDGARLPHGMSLRDWLAGQIIMTFASAELPPRIAAELAYSYADAMLAERNKQDEP